MQTKTNKNPMRYLFFALLTALAMVLATVRPVAAQEEVEITGTVTAIDETAGSFTVETEGGESYVVFAPEGFDLGTLSVGATVEVKGTANEDGSITAIEIIVELADDGDGDDSNDDGDDPSTGYYCTQSEVPHPFGALLAERYETDYETIQGWFCDGFGWGQIMLALQTGKLTEGDPEALLELRRGGAGWGQIWQELKLIGRPDHAGPPNDEDGDGRPDHAGPPNGVGGGGKPDHAGPPEGKGPPHNRP